MHYNALRRHEWLLCEAALNVFRHHKHELHTAPLKGRRQGIARSLQFGSISYYKCVNNFHVLRGLLFEHVAHATLQRGGSFSCADLEGDSAINTTTLEVDKGLKVTIFRTLEEFTLVAAPGVYAQPSARDLHTVDAVLVPMDPSAPVMLLQMTTTGPPHQSEVAPP